MNNYFIHIFFCFKTKWMVNFASDQKKNSLHGIWEEAQKRKIKCIIFHFPKSLWPDNFMFLIVTRQVHNMKKSFHFFCHKCIRCDKVLTAVNVKRINFFHNYPSRPMVTTLFIFDAGIFHFSYSPIPSTKKLSKLFNLINLN